MVVIFMHATLCSMLTALHFVYLSGIGTNKWVHDNAGVDGSVMRVSSVDNTVQLSHHGPFMKFTWIQVR